jgi:hypothetical protein
MGAAKSRGQQQQPQTGRMDGKEIFRKRFTTLDDAIKARKEIESCQPPQNEHSELF